MTILLAIWEVAKKVFGLMSLKDWLIAALLASIVLYHLYAVHEARVAGVAEGAKAAQAQCAADKAAARADYDKRLKEAEDKAKAQENQQATELAVQGANYEKQLQDVEDQRQRDVAAARAGALKLRIAAVRPGASGGSAPAQSAAPAAGSDGAAGGELPPEVAATLLAIADDADQVAHQLTACQAVIQTYMKGPT